MRVYTATVVKAGDKPGIFIVQPHRVRVDAQDAPEIPALAADGIKPPDKSLVLCIESVNAFNHEAAMDWNDNGGACPIIIAQFSAELIRDAILHVLQNLIVDGSGLIGVDLVVKGKASLGEATKFMVLGEPLATWAQKVDSALAALYAWGATGLPPGGLGTGGIAPFPGTPPAPVWEPTNLSDKHKLD